jgi:hypothetical protein
LFVIAQPAGELRRHPVAISIIGTVLIGAVLARFYNVLIFIPAFALIFVAVLGRAFYFQYGLLHSAAEFALLTTSLQIGYVAIPISYAVRVVVRRIRCGKVTSVAVEDEPLPIEAGFDHEPGEA